MVKQSFLVTVALLLFYLTYSQDKKDQPKLQYPFAELGTESPRGVFGTDDRKEVKDAYGFKDFVRATAVMIPKNLITDNRIYGYTLRESLSRMFGTSKFDKNVRFLDQPTSAQCTGFLIAPDILVTAGHCVKQMQDANKYVWVFDYTNDLKYNQTYKYVQVDPNDIYEVAEVLTADLNDKTDDDYSFLRLNRQSTRAPYRFRTSGKVALNTKVNTIGSPTGLPLKFADNAIVVENSKPNWFKNSIDTFPGNSGGPVFDPNGFIEGIMVRVATVQSQNGTYTGDYMYDYICNCIKTVQSTSAYWNAGAQAHRINKVPYHVLYRALYENIAYAIRNNLSDRLNTWLTYSWMINHEYTNEHERFEYIAASYNNLSALQKIFEKSEAQDLDAIGSRLLYTGIRNNNEALVNYVLDHVSFVEILDDPNKPLITAYKNGRSKILLELIDRGFNPNVRDHDGNNLLHLVASSGNTSILQSLASRGVSAMQTNTKGELPEDIAKKFGNKSAKKYLKKLRKKQKRSR
ncbi:trypsin-like peptidase domain-containing protein [Gaetbulibacter aestuarii]|uniref:Serine protease n=1 Tax=Gaetbulibacter aestuarii TaxID=1502358 RepID=A0ABW7N1L2_9FLAO